MRLLKTLVPAVLAILSAWACTPDEKEERQPRIKSITVADASVMLDRGSSATFGFSVQDWDYPIDTDLQSGQLTLVLTDGSTPEEISLESIEYKGLGVYVGTIRDRGIKPSYTLSVQLRIAIRSVSVTYLLSNAFVVQNSTPEYVAPEVSTGLPVVTVNTVGPITSKTQYVDGTVSINGIGKWENLSDLPCQMRGRGNTTWSWPKKPYLLRLDEKESLLGMPAHKRWVLLANFMDRTLMRNLVAMKVSSMTSLAWTPRCQSVELILNGKHKGTYLLIEQVRVSKNRVNISDKGYLLELDFHFDNPVQWIDYHGSCDGMGSGIPFSVKTPDSDEITQEQISWIKNYINEAATAIYGDGFLDPATGYAAYIDIDSFIDYWLVYEVMVNHELRNPGSVFFYKDTGTKIFAGPCWDFDWGVLSFRTSPNAQTGLINRHAIWYDRLFDDPDFRARVRARFDELLPSLETIPDYIDQLEAELTASARLNFEMWDPSEDASMNGGHIINGDERMSFHEAVALLRSNYITHLKAIERTL